MSGKKKSVVVLAHADGWGALSANRVVQHLHEHYPDIDVYLVVSRATKDKEGRIATKLDDLRALRELKETNLQTYFDHIDAMPPVSSDDRKFFTFKELAKRCCADGEVHFTSRGGPKGGEEVKAFFDTLEGKGVTPEIVLSVDTMAILPEAITGRYNCFSTHPGPLHEVKIEGMQGTLRALVHPAMFDRDGKMLTKDNEHLAAMGAAYVQGTLFLQHPELDKGPPIEVVQTLYSPGMSAYEVRDNVYLALTDKMMEMLPTLLDKPKREALIARANEAKAVSDAHPHTRIPELEAEPLARWQSTGVGVPNADAPYGIELIQNDLVRPSYFHNAMRMFFPGTDEQFEPVFNEIFSSALHKANEQRDARLFGGTDSWAQLASGRRNVTITRYDPKTGEPVAAYKSGPNARE